MYVSTFAFIEHRFGADAKGAVLRRLSEADRDLLGGIVLPITWYPLAPFGRLLRVMDGELGKGDFSLITERGQWTATRDLHTLRKAILKFVSIPWVISKGASLWPQFHDTGRWEVRQMDDDHAVAELHDLGVVDDAICASIKGWIQGLASLSAGIKKVEVRHTTCRAKGESVCVYEVKWSAP
jgi:predicted hydrocarbon binding protein